MNHDYQYTPKNGFSKWLDKRLPLMRFADENLLSFPTPKNLNYFYTFGFILTMCLVTQIITGIVLAMHYVPNTSLAFDSIEHIMRDVNYGWLIRYMHSKHLCEARSRRVVPNLPWHTKLCRALTLAG